MTAAPKLSVRLLAISLLGAVALSCGKDEPVRPRPVAVPVAPEKVAAPTPAPAPPPAPAGVALGDPALGAPTPTAEPAGDHCATAAGDVEVRRRGKTDWAPLDTDDPVGEGDWIRTGKLSTSRITFRSGVRVDFDEMSTVEIRVPPKAGGASVAIALKAGTVRANFDAASMDLAPLVGGAEVAGQSLSVLAVDGTEFVIASKDGLAAIFRLTADEDAIRLKVESGSPSVVMNGESSQVAAGTQVEVAKGKRTAAMQQLATPVSVEPSADARLLYRPGVVIPFAWKSVPGAHEYRVQVARDLSFQKLVFSQRIPGVGFKFAPSHDGMYVWRVVARDARGREGELGAVRRVYLEAQRGKDQLGSPDANAVYEYTDAPPKILFTWAADQGARRYRWVLAEGPDLLNQTVKSQVLNDQRLEFSGFPEKGGEFYWGVYAEHDDPVPLFMRPRRLLLKRVRKVRFETVKKIDVWGK